MRNKLFFSTGDNNGYINDVGHAIERTYTGSNTSYPVFLMHAYLSHGLNELGIVKTEAVGNASFRHAKHIITYPHEWAPAMLKEAVLYHLDLLLELDDCGLTLKDALPENILFTANNPVFVDFFSIVSRDDLCKESWLTSASLLGEDPRSTVLRLMFVPYMLLPLMMYAGRAWVEGRELLAVHHCNNVAGLVPHWGFVKKTRLNKAKTHIKSMLGRGDILSDMAEMVIAEAHKVCVHPSMPWRERVVRLRALTTNLDVTPEPSGYSDYYSAKNENFSITDRALWGAKQSLIDKVLNDGKYATLLDIGANTGWFSRLAASTGISVISTDIDMPCVDNLRRIAKLRQSNILPLWMSFDDLIVESYSLDAQGNQQEFPFHMAATARLQSDVVLCLGLLHHLTLGMGKSFAEVASILTPLAQKVLILEFIELDDPLIVNEPAFFPNRSKFAQGEYSKEACLKCFSEDFELENVTLSHPQSRALIIMRRR